MVLLADSDIFINADLTISLSRMPVGEWILLDAQTWVGDHGAGLAFANSGALAGCGRLPCGPSLPRSSGSSALSTDHSSSASKRATQAAPMPESAPVTSTTLPSRRSPMLRRPA